MLNAAPTATPDTDHDPRRWRMLALLAAAELLGMSVWFSGSAVSSQLAERWALDGAQVGWLTTAVQVGFVLGTALSALFNLADVVPSRALFASAATLGALANLGLAAATDFRWALLSRAACGVCLAGVYPPAMKMTATWFRARRGLAIGTIVGALTIGKAGPYLAQAVPALPIGAVVLATSVCTAVAALLVWLAYAEGPYAFPPRRFSWSLVATVVHERRWRLATGGYLGHMAELYSYWTWIPAFLLASAQVPGVPPVSPRFLGALSFGVIAVGGMGCVWGGLVADRIGRAALVTRAMAISGSCALLIGLAFGRSWWLLAPLALVWGFFVIADSAQFSVLVTESVPPHAVGTALTLQTSLGFLLTTITIQLVPLVVARAGWAWAFTLLAVGPVLGILAIRRLGGVTANGGTANGGTATTS
ncbi:MAG: MFS transporter [Gemmatimonas sp.]|jgi:MFS family permease|uniref:MFS transporter n=1 Tax=Gemmatimonas sp. TaxID=1962908 RepID=UPI00391F6752|nr:MFS transporter [Gemmatimonadota bacterium]